MQHTEITYFRIVVNYAHQVAQLHSNCANVLLKMNRLEEALQSAEDCHRMDSNWFKVCRRCPLKYIEDVRQMKGIVAKSDNPIWLVLLKITFVLHLI